MAPLITRDVQRRSRPPRRRAAAALARSLAAILALVWAPSEVGAQFTGDCTATVLNRAVPIDPETGGFELVNVSGTRGLLRVRVTCVEEGVTRTGQSDFFQAVPGGTAVVGDITMGVVDTPPAAIRLIASPGALSGPGQAAQLAVTGVFPDGSVRDLTAPSAGTTYATSNAAIAAVSPEGLVTTVATGTAILSATNEGVLSTAVLVIGGTPGDADGDGLPDEYERANGLDPTDPADAAQDPDGDGLTNLQEFQRGTNPRLADTDGDAIPDGLEIQAGTNPLDASSVNVAAVLASLEIQPARFVMTINTVLGEASRQLRVIGHLIDGRTSVDLTARGTAYSASPGFVCSFATPTGLVLAGFPGTCTLTAQNSGRPATATATVTTFAPIPLSSIPIPGLANNVDVSGGFAYVAAGPAGLQVVDVRDPRSPRIVGSHALPGDATDVRLVGALAFVAAGAAGLQILDVSTPAAPVLVGAADTPGDARDVVLSGSLAYVADGAGGLQIIDVSVPGAPRVVGAADTQGPAEAVAVAGDRAVVVASPPSALRVVDVADPAQPVVLGSVTIAGSALDVVAQGTVAYVAGSTGGLQTVDFGSPSSPVITGTLGGGLGGQRPRDLEIAGRLLLYVDDHSPSFTLDRVGFADLELPTRPAPVFATLDFTSFGRYLGIGIAVAPPLVYRTGTGTGDARLFIGQYLARDEDTLGIAPSVRITAPVPGATVPGGTLLPVTVEAADDVAVAAADLLLDGARVATGTSPPYRFFVTVPPSATSLRLGARAVDFGDNVGVAEDVVITVVPNQPPRLVLTEPAEGATLVEGATIEVSVDASDDGVVRSVAFTLNGAPQTPLFAPPYRIPVVVPIGSTALTVDVTATDDVGQATTVTRTVTVLPDPLTSVVGRLLDGTGMPVAGATVTCLGVTTVTAADGTFTAADVRTARGIVTCLATFTTPDGRRLTVVLAVTPVAGGTTAVGDRTLIPGSRPELAMVAGTSNGDLGAVLDGAESPAVPAETVLAPSTTGLVPVFTGVTFTNPYLRIGVNPFGTLGSHFEGLRFDPTGQGAYALDVIEAGFRCELATVEFQAGGLAYSGLAGEASEADGFGDNVTLEAFEVATNPALQLARSRVRIGPLRVITDTTLGVADRVVGIRVRFENTGPDAITNLAYARSVDWDANPTLPFRDSFDVFDSPAGSRVVRASEGLDTGLHYGLGTSVRPPAIADGQTFCASSLAQYFNNDPNGFQSDGSATLVFALPGFLAPGQSVTLADMTGQFDRDRGAVEGRVLTAAGTPVAGARVTFSNPSLRFNTATLSDGSGVYRLPEVPLGAFSLTATDPATGRVAVASSQVDVKGQTVTVDLVLP